MSNAKIAVHLFIAETTVKTDIARLVMKLSLRDRVQIVVFPYESGLISTAR
jgi:DNA-binding NarL/FixJ family response regulator